ncbi:MAG: hypothetical protein AAB725_01230 [Patescibacteria group bacterium]
MDQNSKENLVDSENQTVSETVEPSPAEVETAPESFDLGTGEQPSSAPVGANQTADDSQIAPQETTETEIQQQAEEVARLPQEDKLAHLREVAQKNSLEKAIRMVKKMNDPWLEDKFHDDLMDDPEWRGKLEELGKIEKL